MDRGVLARCVANGVAARRWRRKRQTSIAGGLTSDGSGDRPSVLLVGPVAPCDGGMAPGGVSQYVSSLARALHEAGWEVAVYADDLPQGAGEVRVTEWGALFGPVRMRYVPRVARRFRGGFATVARAWGDRHRARRLGSRTRTVIAHSLGLAYAWAAASPDVIHYQHADLRPYWGMLAGIDAPMVITAHSLSAFRDFDEPALHQVTEDALRRADVVVSVSEDTKDALEERVAGVSPVVIGNGIDLVRFRQAPPPADDVCGKVVLYQGRVARQKGIPELIAAMSLVRQEVPEAVLVLVGGIEDLDIERLAAEAGLERSAVHALGYLENAELAAWVRRADVAVLPSVVREGQPRTLMEAMAAGRPVVASRVGGIPGLLADGQYGLLVQPGDVDELAHAILRILADGDLAARLGKAAQTASEAFDIRMVIERLMGVYAEAIAVHEQPRSGPRATLRANEDGQSG